MKQLITLLTACYAVITAQAQTYPVKTIQEVQTVSAAELANGNDASPIGATDTIRIRGVVIMDAGQSTLVNGRQVWIQANDGSPFSGIDVYQNHPSGATDGGTGILSLIAGDSVEITGTVMEFQGETEFIPLNTSPATPVTVLDGGKTVISKLIPLSDLNDENRNNKLVTGEQWEGMYVELRNLTVSSVDYFSNNTRVSFNVVDSAGNKMNVSDRFKSQRLPASGGDFVPPSVGDKITSIKGVLLHSKNNRGYELHPFKNSEVVFSAAAPAISNITRDRMAPTSAQSVTVSATITDDNGIASARLFYAVGSGTALYDSVDMTGSGNTYTASIPAKPDGSFIKYYIKATDASAGNLTSKIPNVPAEAPKFYTVRDNGLTIYDLQYTPYSTGNSGYIDMQVTVSGVVTASAPSDSSNLGAVFIQQENLLGWAGIMCTGNAALSTLQVGDKVTATGTVKENFGFTRLESIVSLSKTGTGTITPLTISPDSFSTYAFTRNEPFEGMLIRFAHPDLQVVDRNADDPSNFAEYRVGTDPFDPNRGCRILAGRVTSSVFSSLSVSYVNDSMWTVRSSLPVLPVQVGTTMDEVQGIMTYSFSNMKLLPRNNNDYVNVKNTTVGVEIQNEETIRIYPNPATDMIHIEGIAPGNNTLVVYNLFGEEIIRMDFSGEISANLSGMDTGMYLYRIFSEGQQFAQGKLMILTDN